jgi:hypothetical protein
MKLVVSFMLWLLYQQKRAHGVHWIGSWVGYRPGLDSGEKRKICFCCRKSNPGPPALDLLLYRLILFHPGFL